MENYVSGVCSWYVVYVEIIIRLSYYLEVRLIIFLFALKKLDIFYLAATVNLRLCCVSVKEESSNVSCGPFGYFNRANNSCACVVGFVKNETNCTGKCNVFTQPYIFT